MSPERYRQGIEMSFLHFSWQPGGVLLRCSDMRLNFIGLRPELTGACTRLMQL
jgi:hypothetical protein